MLNVVIVGRDGDGDDDEDGLSGVGGGEAVNRPVCMPRLGAGINADLD